MMRLVPILVALSACSTTTELEPADPVAFFIPPAAPTALSACDREVRCPDGHHPRRVLPLDADGPIAVMCIGVDSPITMPRRFDMDGATVWATGDQAVQGQAADYVDGDSYADVALLCLGNELVGAWVYNDDDTVRCVFRCSDPRCLGAQECPGTPPAGLGG